jgi:hypothetical protein
MNYLEHSPDFRLTPFIETYWTADDFTKNGSASKILPDGCVDIIFTFDGKTDTFRSDSASAFYLIGLGTGLISFFIGCLWYSALARCRFLESTSYFNGCSCKSPVRNAVFSVGIRE